MSLTQQSLQPSRIEYVAVWDPLVRWGHWALVAAFAIAYLSAEEEGASPATLHIWGGYVVGALVLLRLAWGFVGPQRARFTDFIYRPATALHYFTGLLRGHARRYLGHSPAGGAMVVTLLVSLAATVGTGWIAYNSPSRAVQMTNPSHIAAAAYANGAEQQQEHRAAALAKSNGEESFVAELHDALANITLALVIMHVLGVGLASFVHRENLVAAMITGRKRARDGG